MSFNEEFYYLWLDDAGWWDADAGFTNLALTKEQWQADVRRELSAIDSRTVGRMLLQSIRFHGLRANRWVRIYAHAPFVGSEHCVPGAFRRDETRPRGATIGHVRFTPSKYAQGSLCARALAIGGTLPPVHEMLFHELVHAFRHVSDKGSLGPPPSLKGGLWRYSNKEEFICIVLTNVYASANGRTALRADHRDRAALDDKFSGSFKFFQSSGQTFGLIEEFCNENKGFAQMLAEVKTAFNPIRAYHRDPRTARQYSERSSAARLDLMGDAGWWMDRVMN